MNLQRCPFCGSADVEVSDSQENFGLPFWIRCNACAALGPSAATPYDAARLWNERGATIEVTPEPRRPAPGRPPLVRFARYDDQARGTVYINAALVVRLETFHGFCGSTGNIGPHRDATLIVTMMGNVAVQGSLECVAARLSDPPAAMDGITEADDNGK